MLRPLVKAFLTEAGKIPSLDPYLASLAVWKILSAGSSKSLAKKFDKQVRNKLKRQSKQDGQLSLFTQEDWIRAAEIAPYDLYFNTIFKAKNSPIKVNWDVDGVDELLLRKKSKKMPRDKIIRNETGEKVSYDESLVDQPNDANGNIFFDLICSAMGL